MTEAEIVIDYLSPEGSKCTHTVRSEIDVDDFLEEVREAVELVRKDGFFSVMEEKRHVYVPPTQVLQIAFNLIDSEDGS